MLLPLLIQSQPVTVDGERLFVKKSTDSKLYKLPEVPKNIGVTTYSFLSSGITSDSVLYYGGSSWYDNWTTEVVKGKVETPVNVMDSGMKVEVVETRDTIYKCPYSNSITFFTTTTTDDGRKMIGCSVDKIVTTRRYKLYIINEYGQKEYLSMELSKVK